MEGRIDEGERKDKSHLVNAREVSKELHDLRAVEDLWWRRWVGRGLSRQRSGCWRGRSRSAIFVDFVGGHCAIPG